MLLLLLLELPGDVPIGDVVVLGLIASELAAIARKRSLKKVLTILTINPEQITEKITYSCLKDFNI